MKYGHTKYTGIWALAVVLVFLITGATQAVDEAMSQPQKQMPQDKQIKLALSAAPAHIAKEAAVMLQGEDGKLVEAKKGTNGFTCVPKVDPNVPTYDPMCMDEAGFQWLTSAMNNEQKPGNTAPGIAYMAKGAHSWIKDKKVVRQKEPGAKLVGFPAHWMIFWPFESKTSGLPNCPTNPKLSRSGMTCVAEDGSPFAFLAIFQDPAKIKSK